MKQTFRLSELNSCTREDFVRRIGPVFEHSPWIAEATWGKRPFEDMETLHRLLCDTVRNAGQAEQLALIRAHPDLVGRAAQAGSLTPESSSEQASAGLDKLTAEEIGVFQNSNQAYREKFGFPFVICARLNKKEAIIRGFRERLQHAQAKEIETALEEIYKIAYLRLEDIVAT